MMTTSVAPLVGVLALQGAYRAHAEAFSACGARVRDVKVPTDLDGLDAIVLPGGESTTMSRLLDTSSLRPALTELIESGVPVFATCAGLILMSATVLDGREDQRGVASLDIAVRRNGYGRQVDSFETDLDVTGLEEPFHAVFIRAPVILDVGPQIEVLASDGQRPVLVRSGRHVAMSFHPELVDDLRLHAMFLKEV